MENMQWVTTKESIIEFQFGWEIKDIYEILKFNREYESQIYTCPKTLTNWQLKHVGKNCVEYYLQYCRHNKNNLQSIKAEVYFAILNPFNKSEVLQEEASVKIYTPGFYNRVLAINSAFKDLEGTMKCCIRIHMEPQHIRQPSNSLSNDSFNILKMNLEVLQNELVEKEDTSICKIIVKTNEDSKNIDKFFMFHQAILSAQSNVFKAMFESDMKEGKTKIVTITDFHSNIIDDMRGFLYFGTIKNIQENGMELIKFANKYLIQTLKDKCEAYLIENISKVNVIDYLILADIHNLPNLKNFAKNYFYGHKEQLKMMDSFKKLQMAHPNLLLELI